MNLKFGLDELATEGEHAARIVAVKELGIVKGQFRSEEKVRITFEMLDRPDANGDLARFASKVMDSKTHDRQKAAGQRYLVASESTETGSNVQ